MVTLGALLVSAVAVKVAVQTVPLELVMAVKSDSVPPSTCISVSYTHLTLPTNREV